MTPDGSGEVSESINRVPSPNSGGLSDHWVSDADELPDGQRLFWCPDCGHVFDRHHNHSGEYFCNNCEFREAVLIGLKPVGPGAENYWKEVATDGGQEVGDSEQEAEIHCYECNDCGIQFDWTDIDKCPNCGSEGIEAIRAIADGGQSVSRTPQDGKYLRFAHTNVGYVLDGVEDCTFRYNLCRDLSEGDAIRLLTPSGDVFGTADVLERYSTRVGLAFGDAVGIDDRRHPADGSVDLLERLRSHYEAEPIDMDTEVSVIYFDLVTPTGVDDAE